MKKLKLKGEDSEETKVLYINYYLEHYIVDEDNNEIVIKTREGEMVYFRDNLDTHAFTGSRKISGKKTERYFDFAKARILSWIREIIEENSKLEIIKKDYYDLRKKIWKRYYLYPEKKYFVVLLKDKKGDFVFKSHYRMNNSKKYKNKLKFLSIN